MSTRLATTLLAASVLLVACRHTEVALQQPANTTPGQHFLGTSTEAEMVADDQIRQHIVGTWTTADDPQSAPYDILTILPNGSFSTVKTNRPKLVSEGTWFVERGFLLLVRSNAPPFDYYGFHKIRQMDGHHLVCGPRMSMAGELKFTK